VESPEVSAFRLIFANVIASAEYVRAGFG
jgi:hypothetical protein